MMTMAPPGRTESPLILANSEPSPLIGSLPPAVATFFTAGWGAFNAVSPSNNDR